MTKKAIVRIVLFYTIGITLSNVFRFDLLHLYDPEQPLSVLQHLLTSPLGAIGLLIGGLISLYLLKKERNPIYSMFGTSLKWSLIMVAIPILLLGFFGAENGVNANVHYYGLMGGIGTFIYCLCEEIGWRGYLQDELHPTKEWKRVLLIGTLWYFWHLPFITNQNISDNIQFLAWMILGSWGIGKVIDLTRSIVAATCFHMIINLMMYNEQLTRGLNTSVKLYVLGISIACWIAILIIWKKQTRTITHPV